MGVRFKSKMAFLTVWGLATVFGIGFWVVVVYVAWHFISKYW